MDIVYKEATREDIDALVRLRIDYLMSDHPDMTDEEIRKIMEVLPGYFEKHLGVDLDAFIAIDMMYHGEAVASAFLLTIEKPANPTFINGKVGEVLNVFTKEDYRGEGIAHSLISMLLQKGHDLDLDYIKLLSTDAGYNLYKSLGFEDSISDYHEMKYKY